MAGQLRSAHPAQDAVAELGADRRQSAPLRGDRRSATTFAGIVVAAKTGAACRMNRVFQLRKILQIAVTL
jgi:hypothetical protein